LHVKISQALAVAKMSYCETCAWRFLKSSWIGGRMFERCTRLDHWRNLGWRLWNP